MAKYLDLTGLGKVWAKIKGNFVSALGTSGNYLTWTKNGTTNNITVPYATSSGTAAKVGSSTVGSNQQPVYINNGTPTVSNPGEAYLTWGGKNFSGDYGPVDAAMVSELGAPRTMFFKAAGIVIEYSTNAGSTWTDYGATDAQKVALFSSGQGFVIGKATKETASANNMLRVTLHTSVGGLYTVLNKFVIYVTTSGSTGCYCTIRCRTQQNYEDNVDTWVTRADHVGISGWSGYNVINIAGTATYGNTKSTQYGEWQFIFGCTGHNNSSYAGLSISKIFGFGGQGWTAPSYMARTGHLYGYNSSQEAFFPASIYPDVNNSNLGSSSKRWNLYGTTGNFTSATNPLLVLNNTGTLESAIQFQRSGTTKAWIGYRDNYGVYLYNSARSKYLQYKDDGSLLFEENTVWHSGNSNLSTVDWTAKDITATSFKKSGGTSSQFLKADGSVDSNAYSTTSHNHDSAYLKLTGGTLTGPLTVSTPSGGSAATITLNNGNGYASIRFCTVAAASSGGWARSNIAWLNKAGDASVFNIGSYGSGETLSYLYLGTGDYNSTDNTRLAPNGDVTVKKLIIHGGTSSQFLKADGSRDSTAYLTPTTGVQKKESSYFYPFIKSVYLNGSNTIAKITFPCPVTKTSNAWYMMNCDVVVGHSWQAKPNGKILLQYYFLYTASTGAFTADGVRAIMVGSNIGNQLSLWYDISNPKILYIQSNSGYTSVAIENLCAADTGASYDYMTTTMEAMAVGNLPSGLSKVPMSIFDSPNGTDVKLNNSNIKTDADEMTTSEINTICV